MRIVRYLAIAVPLVLLVAVSTQVPTPPETTRVQVDPSPSQSEDPQAEIVPVACGAATQAEVEKTINAQTQAFAQDNFELAYSYASPSFRSNVSLNGFVAIISGSYGPLIESSELRFSDCLANPNGGFALIDVNFLQGGDFVYALRYLLVETSDGWRVDGASDLEVVGEGT